MKSILCLTSHDLNAPDYGSVLRCRHIFQALSRFGRVDIVLGSRYEDVLENARSRQGDFELIHKIHFRPSKYSLLERLSRRLTSTPLDIEGYQATRRDSYRLQRLMDQYDLVWVHGLETADAFNIPQWPRAILDVDDLPSTVYRSRLVQPDTNSARYWNNRKMKLWRRCEKDLAERFEAICVCGECDRQELGAAKNIFVLPNGFSAPDHAPRRNPVQPPQIGFVGTFIYGPNRDGVRWFIDNIWPTIKEKMPNARLRLAGQKGQSFFNSPGVDALGWVHDMESEMANWSVAIVPILVGGGTRIKILEAFSRKCPVVSTSLGAYGHEVESGQELLLADSPAEFARHCLRILANPSEGNRLAENAWNKFLKKWTWESHTARLSEILKSVWKGTLPLESQKVEFKVEIRSEKSHKKSISAAHGVKNPPAVSVVIPAFNRMRSVVASVDSVLSQTYKDFEIVVVDDGSSDGTADVLEKFGDCLRLIRQENRGVSSARNTGVRAARGRWIAFLDSDDQWHPEKLELQLKAMEKYAAQISFTRCVNTENEPLRDIEFVSSILCGPEIFSVQNAADSVCISPRHPMIQTMVVEKRLLEKAGLFDESFFAAEDAELIFRLSFLSGFIYIDRPLATVYEKSVNSLTYNEELDAVARRNQSYLRLLAHMYWRMVEKSPEKISVMRERLGYFISRRAEIACAAGEWRVARTLARDGILFAGNFRDFARCAGILLCPALVRSRAEKKWPA